MHETESTSQIKTIGEVLAVMVLSKLPSEKRVCADHGEFVDYSTPAGWAGCPGCHERGLAARKQLHDAQLRASARESRLRSAAIPPRFADKRLSNFQPHCDGATQALAQATDYAANFPRHLKSGASMILCGTVGSGKTHLAVGIAHEVIALDRTAVFSSVIDAIRCVKNTYSRDSDMKESDALEQFIRPDLLILDEIGVQFGSATEEQILFQIINGRYQEMRPTIVISNLDTQGIESYLGVRAFDRLREGGGKLIAFDWPSYRRMAKV